MKEYAAKLSIFLFFCVMGSGDFLNTRQGFSWLVNFSRLHPFNLSEFQPFMRGPKTWGSKTGARLPEKG